MFPSVGLRPPGAPRHRHFGALLVVCNGIKENYGKKQGKGKVVPVIN
jgi:hypothetical protein